MSVLKQILGPLIYLKLGTFRKYCIIPILFVFLSYIYIPISVFLILSLLREIDLKY